MNNCAYTFRVSAGWKTSVKEMPAEIVRRRFQRAGEAVPRKDIAGRTPTEKSSIGRKKEGSRGYAASFLYGRVVQKRCSPSTGGKTRTPREAGAAGRVGRRRRPGAQAKKKQTQQAPAFSEPCGGISDVVPVAGVEPARCRQRWILSPLRLPIPSYRQIAGVL